MADDFRSESIMVRTEIVYETPELALVRLETQGQEDTFMIVRFNESESE